MKTLNERLKLMNHHNERFFPELPLTASFYTNKDGVEWLQIAFRNSGWTDLGENQVYNYHKITLDKRYYQSLSLPELLRCGKGMLHAVPRTFAKSKDGIESQMSNLIEIELQYRAWRNEPSNKPRSTKKSKGCSDRDRKKVYSVKSKSGKLFNYVWKQIIERTADKECLKIAYRYPPSFRYTIYALCCKSDRFKQICVSFPVAAAFVANANDLRSWSEVNATIPFEVYSMIEDGKPLTEIAEKMGASMWLRKVKPQNTVFLQRFVSITDTFFREYLPHKTMQQYRYLRYSPVGRGMYLNLTVEHWVMKNIPLTEKSEKLNVDVAHVRDYIYSSIRENADFKINCSWKTALERADEWTRQLNRQRAQDQLLADEKRREEYNKPFPAQWIEDDETNGYKFKYLNNEQALINEGRAMEHCVASYAWRCRDNNCQIYSVTKNGKRIGTLELIEGFPVKFMVNQFRGKCNSKPENDANIAVSTWLQNHYARIVKYGIVAAE